MIKVVVLPPQLTSYTTVSLPFELYEGSLVDGGLVTANVAEIQVNVMAGMPLLEQVRHGALAAINAALAQLNDPLPPVSAHQLEFFWA